MPSYTYLTAMEVRAQVESAGARIGRIVSCVGQEKKVVGVLSVVVISIIIITIVFSMVSFTDKNSLSQDLKSAYMKSMGNSNRMLHILEKDGEVFMEMNSYDEGLVIIKLNAHLYHIIPGLITITNMTMHLKTIREEDVQWKNKTTFELNTKIFSKVVISKEVTNPAYPEAGIYVKSYGYGINLMAVFYFSNTLVGMKLTGSVFVPSGKTSFTINMKTQEVKVQHASTGYKDPYWSDDYVMGNITKYSFEMENYLTTYDDTVYYHISRFVPIVIM